MNDRCSSIARHATFKAVLGHSRILFLIQWRIWLSPLITGQPFKGLSNLRHLDLSQNHLRGIQTGDLGSRILSGGAS